MFERILVAHDGSDGAQRTFDQALELAVRLNARLAMISVEDDLPNQADTMQEIDEAKDSEDSYFGRLAAQAQRKAALRGLTLERTIVPGHEVKAIAEMGKEGTFDLLVIGYTGHSKIYDQLWGRTPQSLTRVAPCSVLVVK